MDESALKEQLSAAEEQMNDSIAHLERELTKIRTGKASPDILSGIFVPYYGSNTPLGQVANISTADARTLVIQPWEKSMLAPIEKAIFEANLGLTPQNDGEIVRISIPPLTQERRKELVKRAKALGEETKVSVRNVRREAMDAIKKAIKDGFPEDAGKREEDTIQKLTDGFVVKIDKVISTKEGDIMTI